MGKKSPKSRSAKAEGTEPKSTGRLVALDGLSGRDLEDAAQDLVERLGGAEAGVAASRWDASNTFFELRLGKGKNIRPPVRTLLLLYAADLLFRFRWEIQPAIDEGRTVVAAPYLETAIAYGLACGVSREWLDELFRFAPKPAFCLRPKEKVKSEKKQKAFRNGKALKTARGFIEFSNALMGAGSRVWNNVEINAAVLKYLEGCDDRGEILRLKKKLPKALGKL